MFGSAKVLCSYIFIFIFSQFVRSYMHLSFTGLRKLPFTEAPKDPTFVAAGKDARLKWNYDSGDLKRIDMQYKKSGGWVTMLSKNKAGSVSVNSVLPASLKSRITIEGNATLVISAVNTGDSTKYKCIFVRTSGSLTEEGPIQLIVTGILCRLEGWGDPQETQAMGYYKGLYGIMSDKIKGPEFREYK